MTRIQTQHARTLRQTATPAERALWHALRNRACGRKVRRQIPCGPFIADFLIPSARLIIELDGLSHDGARDRDAQRDAWLAARGYRVLRFTNADVLGNLEGVVRAIVLAANAEDDTSPSPSGRGPG